MTQTRKAVVHHIPVCPFCQRLEILLERKNARDAVDFVVVDVTKPRDPTLLAKTRGSTLLPVLETDDGRLLQESLVLLRYLDERFSEVPVAQPAPYARAVENMLIALEGDFVAAGYRYVMNQDRDRRAALHDAFVAQYAKLDDFLRWQAPNGDFLFDGFGLAEVVFTPMFQRFWFAEYYEGFEIPEGLERVKRWRDACLAHPQAQQVSREEIVKLYYDYSRGAGNGALPPGRSVSSFVFEPDWRERPWPPRDKWGHAATDEELGLV